MSDQPINFHERKNEVKFKDSLMRVLYMKPLISDENGNKRFFMVFLDSNDDLHMSISTVRKEFIDNTNLSEYVVDNDDDYNFGKDPNVERILKEAFTGVRDDKND